MALKGSFVGQVMPRGETLQLWSSCHPSKVQEGEVMASHTKVPLPAESCLPSAGSALSGSTLAAGIQPSAQQMSLPTAH